MDLREMDCPLPNFKIGDAVSNTFQNNNLIVTDDPESSFVVLAKNVIESPKLLSNNKESPQKASDDVQLVSSNTSRISRIESKLCEMLAENIKLKNTLEENDTIMKQQFEKIEAWQNEVMSVCQNHNKKYMKTKQLIDMMKTGNEYLCGLVKNQQESSLLMNQSPVLNADCINFETANSLADIENELHKMLEKNKDLREHSEKLVAHHKDFVSFYKNQTNESVETEELLNQGKALTEFSNSKVQDQLQNDIEPQSRAISNEGKDVTFDSTSLAALADSSVATNGENNIAQKDSAAIAVTPSAIRERESSLDNNMMVISLKSAGATQTSTAKMECINLERNSETTFVDIEASITGTKCINAEHQPEMVTSESTKQPVELEKIDSLNSAIMAMPVKDLLENGNEIETSNNCREIFPLQITMEEETKLQTCNFSTYTLMDEETRKKYAEVEKRFNEWNEMLSKERASLIQRQISLNAEKTIVQAKLSEIMTEFTVLNREKEIVAIERKGFQDVKEAYNRQQELHAIEKSMIEEEILLVQQKNEQLTRKLKEIEAENELMQTEKKDILLERENLEELKKLLDDEMKSHEEEHSAVLRENDLLKSKCDMLEIDVQNFNTELIDKHKMITKLRNENIELRNIADTLETYKVQNDVQAKDILHMFNVEQNYLEEIERLSIENEKLKEENNRLENQSD